MAHGAEAEYFEKVQLPLGRHELEILPGEWLEVTEHRFSELGMRNAPSGATGYRRYRVLDESGQMIRSCIEFTGINERWQAEKRRWVERNPGAGKEIARQKARDDEIRRKAQIADTMRIQRLLAPGIKTRQEYVEGVKSSVQKKVKAGRIHGTEDEMLRTLENDDFAKTITIVWKMLDIAFTRYEGLKASDIIPTLKKDPLAAFPHLVLLYSQSDLERLMLPKY